jgi:hypothetical protein
MSAECDLAKACQQWRHLVETEGEAIKTGDWSLVFACQKALLDLQKLTTHLLPATRAEWLKSGCDRMAKEGSLQATLCDLIKLERRNQTLLGAMQEAVRVKLDQFTRAGRTLKRLQGSYGSIQPAGWTSFS